MCVGNGNAGINASRCLTHSFTVHTRYEVAPPYPQFVPYVSMVCPGVAVFNTGDSLVAVDVHVEDGHWCLLSAASDRCPVFCTTSEADVTDDDDDQTLSASESALADAAVSQSSLAVDVATSDDQASPRDATNTAPTELRIYRERNSSLGKENQLKLAGHVGNSGIDDEDVCKDIGMSLSKRDDESSQTDTSAVVIATSSSTVMPPHMSVNSSLTVDSSLHFPSDVLCSDKCSATPELLRLTVMPSCTIDSTANVNVGMNPSVSGSMPPGHVTTSSYSSRGRDVIVHNDNECSTYSLRRYSAAATPADVEGNCPRSHSLLLCCHII